MSKTVRLPAAGLLLVAVATATVTQGCTNQPYTSPEQQAQNACRAFGPKTVSGAAIGALGGAAAGASLGAIAGGGRGAGIGAGVGALAGLIGGLAVGHGLDQRDCAAAQQALAQVQYVPIGQPVSWNNPRTGTHGSYTPVSAEYPAGDDFCRRVRQDTAINGHQPTSEVLVTCRTPDGNYATVQEPTA